jgi:hypothetical protein
MERNLRLHMQVPPSKFDSEAKSCQGLSNLSESSPFGQRGGPNLTQPAHFGPPRQHSQCLFSGAAAFATKPTVEQDSHTATYCHDANFAAPYPIWASPLVAIYLRVSSAALLIALRL